MAVIAPTSWGDLDWNSPEPNDLRYWLSIQAALVERAAVTGLTLEGIQDAFGYREHAAPHLIERISSSTFLSALNFIAGRFVNVDATLAAFEDGSLGYGDAPIRWSLDSLAREVGDDLLTLAVRGSVQSSAICDRDRAARFLCAMKAAVNQLHITLPGSRRNGERAPRVDGSARTNWAQAYSESGGNPELISRAAYMSGENIRDEASSLTEPTIIGEISQYYTHREYDDLDIYSVARNGQLYSFSRLLALPHSGRAYDAIVSVYATTLTDAVTYFDGTAEGIRFVEGFNHAVLTERISSETASPSDLLLIGGHHPSVRPPSVDAAAPYATRGYRGRVYLWLDHAVEGGFRFRAV